MSRAGRRKLTKRHRIAAKGLIKHLRYQYTLEPLECLRDPLERATGLYEKNKKGGYFWLYESA